MPGKTIKLECPNCKRSFSVDLDQLASVAEQIVYRGQRQKWRTQCPRCNTFVVFTVETGKESKNG